MRLSLRKPPTALPNEPNTDAGHWGPKIAPIGRALDAYQTPLRDVAVSIAGSTALVTALSWQAGRYRDSWLPIDFGLVLDESPSERPDHTPSRTGWERRLRMLGQELDQVAGLSDPLILAMDDGFVVTASARGAMTSWEVAG